MCRINIKQDSKGLFTDIPKVSKINAIHCFMRDVITHPYSTFSGALAKATLKLEHGWVRQYNVYPNAITYLCLYLHSGLIDHCQ